MSTTQFMPGGAIHLHRHDLPEGLVLGPVIAVDTETMGLQPHRDRLCLVQLSTGTATRTWCSLCRRRWVGTGSTVPT